MVTFHILVDFAVSSKVLVLIYFPFFLSLFPRISFGFYVVCLCSLPSCRVRYEYTDMSINKTTIYFGSIAEKMLI